MVGFIGIIVASLIISVYAGYYECKDDSSGLRIIIISLFIYILFGAHSCVNSRTHVLFGTDKAKFYNNDNVILPNGETGKIEDIYYLIEDSLYQEKTIYHDSLR